MKTRKLKLEDILFRIVIFTNPLFYIFILSLEFREIVKDYIRSFQHYQVWKESDYALDYLEDCWDFDEIEENES